MHYQPQEASATPEGQRGKRRIKQERGDPWAVKRMGLRMQQVLGGGLPFGRDFTFEVAVPMFGTNVPFTSTHQTSMEAPMPMPVPASKLACL